MNVLKGLLFRVSSAEGGKRVSPRNYRRKRVCLTLVWKSKPDQIRGGKGNQATTTRLLKRKIEETDL